MSGMKSISTSKKNLPEFLKNLQNSLFDPFELLIEEVYLDEESKEYNACYLTIKNIKFIFRTAKSTPKKIGQFVTLWKRSKNGPIEPFLYKDNIDLYIIETINQNKTGYFLFSKVVLNEKGILFGKHIGKRGFRVYPSWDKPNNKQGITTQKWQLSYFVESTDIKDNLKALKTHLEIFIK
ncbi:MepB family protein [Leptospira bandrabouensis]|uniref:MepB family protein n=1 Tax=Leptospira bandrabouensis TaxID=2484903 RepID=UPI003B8A6CE6